MVGREKKSQRTRGDWTRPSSPRDSLSTKPPHSEKPPTFLLPPLRHDPKLQVDLRVNRYVGLIGLITRGDGCQTGALVPDFIYQRTLSQLRPKHSHSTAGVRYHGRVVVSCPLVPEGAHCRCTSRMVGHAVQGLVSRVGTRRSIPVVFHGFSLINPTCRSDQ
ncbi:uncharacterized protein BO72DRAFT_205610 [Aspergillus fijiensis CBS 313.89]|uniref:Uncharacterized protein n=1 Tax=Aspergillus fijiensis CBS 313.89 TaxID=1448319 RepID=A0A8G1RI69_9EURO|nr:uncharacterized protein BO72DRAFT_205610 [Aspergillus fijiensis CBS 313.89]RAK74392.1 hypothetical protein BO72DRAFT_205610 [Aspergillus fijiensis CBS 313.89]